MPDSTNIVNGADRRRQMRAEEFSDAPQGGGWIHFHRPLYVRVAGQHRVPDHTAS